MQIAQQQFAGNAQAMGENGIGGAEHAHLRHGIADVQRVGTRRANQGRE
jgi:hypothetical protein